VVQEPATLALLGTLTRNVAQNPREEKYRRVRLTNPKIAAALVDIKGAVDVMLHLGWVHVRLPTYHGRRDLSAHDCPRPRGCEGVQNTTIVLSYA
jgi:hypothetical protein